MNELARSLLAAGLCLVLGFSAGWGVNGWRLDAKYSHEAEARAQAAAKQLATLTADRDAKAAALTVANDRHMKELQGAQNETNRLRDCLRSGTCGLRIAATCSPAQTPGATAAPSVDSGAGAELAETARRAYFALRDGIDRAGSQLAACQDELRLRAAPSSP